jgi:D-3-phosphoglycerate dehydrogenase
VLSLVSLAARSAARLRRSAALTLRPWTETHELADPEELARELTREGIDALFVEADFVFAETLEQASGLHFIGVCRGDYGHVDVAAATRAGVAVVHTPGRNAAAVAELTLGLMLALLRRIPEADRLVRERRWGDPLDGYLRYRGAELGTQVVGIIGLGAIGRRTAELLAPHGCRVLATDPALSDGDIRAAGCEPADLRALLAAATVVTVHCPPLESTSGLLDARAIARMRPGARLIVTSGEGVVDETAVAAALADGHLAGAAFDVFETHPIRPDHPLLTAPNAILLPHIGGATDATVERYSEMVVDDYLRFVSGQRPRHLVNPEVWNHRA